MSFSHHSGLHWFSGDALQPPPFCRWVERGVGVQAAGPPPCTESVLQKASNQLSPGARFPTGISSFLGQGLAYGFLHRPCIWRRLI